MIEIVPTGKTWITYLQQRNPHIFYIGFAANNTHTLHWHFYYHRFATYEDLQENLLLCLLAQPPDAHWRRQQSPEEFRRHRQKGLGAIMSVQYTDLLLSEDAALARVPNPSLPQFSEIFSNRFQDHYLVGPQVWTNDFMETINHLQAYAQT